MWFALLILALMNLAQGVVIWQLLNRLLAQARIQPLHSPMPEPQKERVEAPKPRTVFTIPLQG